MLPVSDAFLELMKTNVRPKVEPKITVKDALGEGKDIVWTAKKIKDLSFKRAIDPIGRTLSFMELKWTEVFQGKLNKNSYPQIYENVLPFLPVTLEFSQSLDFYNTWKTILNSGKTWKEIFEEKTTWKQLKEVATSEIVRYPILFLSGKPIVNKNVIEWTAYDLLHYFDSTETTIFNAGAHRGKIAARLLVNACSHYTKQKSMIESVVSSIEDLKNGESFGKFWETELADPIVFDGKINSLLKDYFSVFDRYLDFKDEKIIIRTAFDTFIKTDICFPLKLLYEPPQVTLNNNVSSYQCKKYYVQENEQKKYEKKWNNYYVILGDPSSNNDIYVFEYVFDKYGRGVGNNVDSDINRALYLVSLPNGTIPNEDEYAIEVIPIESNAVDVVVPIGESGDAFSEDNKLNPYDRNSFYVGEDRPFGVLKRYFNSECYSLEFSCAPNIAIETGDIINIETNLEDRMGNNIKKDAVVVEISFKYSGKLTQTIKAHEVIL